MTADRFCTAVEKKMKGGLFSIMVLHTIGTSDGPIHGYMITKLLDDMTSGAIYIQAGTIYPILRNLETQGLIEHTQVRSIRGPPRKCYSLTDEGESALEELDVVLDDLLGAVAKVRQTSVGQ